MFTLYSLAVDALTQARGVIADPVISWRLASDSAGENQATYRVLILERGPKMKPVWASDRIESDNNRHACRNVPLRSSTVYVARVESVSTSGDVSTSEIEFGTGLLDSSEWSASWIFRDLEPMASDPGGAAATPTDLGRSWQTAYSQAPLQVRRCFSIDRAVESAVIHVSAKGVYRLFVNGHAIGDHELSPGWTDYASRIEYQSFDVSQLLRTGANCVSAEVSDGWWSGSVGYDTRRHGKLYGEAPEFLAQLEMRHSDGTADTLVSDGSWRERPGHIVMADLLMGEYHDLALATTGWQLADYDDATWRPVMATVADTTVLAPSTAPPVRVLQTLAPHSITQIEDGFIVDFGQNLVGRVHLRLHSEPRGRIIRIRHGEMLEHGRLYVANLRTAEATDIVVTDGSEIVDFEPHHTIHGFRFIEVTGAARLVEDDVEAVVVGSDLAQTGSVATSSPLVNQLISNIRWGQRGNFVSIPTDCPQRDERLGWTADAQIFAATAAYNSDVRAFFSGWLRELRHAQRPDGSVPDVIPLPPGTTNLSWGAPAWGDAVTLVPWTLYRAYGDTQVLAEALPSIRSWSDYVHARTTDGLWDRGLGNNYGDWLSVDGDTPKTLIATAYLARTSEIAAQTATILHEHDHAAVFHTRAKAARAAFRREFVSADGTVAGETQTGYLMALGWNLAPDELRAAMTAHLAADIERRGHRLTTGFLGVSLLGPVLSSVGRSDLAYALLLQQEYPSWGYSIRYGATTVWERWDGWTAERGFQSITMNSFNHYSLGSVGEWIYSGVAGIGQAADSAGFRRIRIEPMITNRLDWVEAHYEAPRGLIRCIWRRKDHGSIDVDVTVPPGCTALVRVGETERSVGSGVHAFVDLIV